MRRFADAKASRLYEAPYATSVAKNVGTRAHTIIRLLVAAHTWQDVGIIGVIKCWLNAPDRYGLHVHGKWHIMFAWSEDFGAYDICFERR